MEMILMMKTCLRLGGKRMRTGGSCRWKWLSARCRLLFGQGALRSVQ